MLSSKKAENCNSRLLLPILRVAELFSTITLKTGIFIVMLSLTRIDPTAFSKASIIFILEKGCRIIFDYL
jgi:hypothetical protein